MALTIFQELDITSSGDNVYEGFEKDQTNWSTMDTELNNARGGEATLDTRLDLIDGATNAISQTMTNKTLTSAVLNTGVSGTAFLDEDNMASNSATKFCSQQSIKAFVTSGTVTMTNKTLTSAVLNTGVSGTAFLDEDNMASNSATKFCSQQSIKAFVTSGTVTMTNKTLTTPTIGDLTNATHDHADAAGGGTFTNLAIGGDLQVNGGDIGITADTDLIQLASGALTVNGTLATTNNITVTAVAPIVNINSTTAGKSVVRLQSEGSTKAQLGLSGRIEGDSTADLGLFAETGQGIRFYTNGLAAEKATIDSTGNTTLAGDLRVDGGDIGITADTDLIQLASGALTVNGTITATSTLIVNGGNIGIIADTDLIQMASGALIVNGTFYSVGNITVEGNVNPNTDGTRDLGTQTTAQWANVWADLVNGSDYSLLNGWRILESDKYEGYPKGFAIGSEGFTDGVVTKTMPKEVKPLFAITEDFIEYKGHRIMFNDFKALFQMIEKLQE